MSTLGEAGASAATAERLVESAHAIGRLLGERRDEIQQLRDLPPEIGGAMREAGLFRLYQPAEWGGLESDPRAFLQVQSALAEHCLSAAWVQGVLAVQPLLVARFPPAAQADVWQSDPSAVVASAQVPTGKAVPEEGGYRLSGRWHFASGCSFGDWILVGGLVPGAAADGPPELRVFLVPRADWRIDDIWHSFGLRGTASNDILIDDAFVPVHRSHVPDFGIQNATRAQRPGPLLYRLPWLPLFALATSNLAVGGGRAALRCFLDVTRTRIGGMSGKPAREDPAVLELCARLAAETDLIDHANRHIAGRMIGHVAADTVISMEEALRMRHQATTALRKITAIVEEMTLLAGAKGVMERMPLTRIWLDLCAARLHPGNDPSGPAGLLGQMLMDGAAA